MNHNEIKEKAPWDAAGQARRDETVPVSSKRSATDEGNGVVVPPLAVRLKEFVKNDAEKNPLHLLPTVAIEHVGLVLAFGAKKYAPGGWRKVDKRSRYYSAALRHLFAWWRGENLDPESGLPHLSHACCSILFLLEADVTGLGVDDRPGSEGGAP